MNATRQQQKLFFALCAEGNWNKNKAMEHAAKLYSLKSFTDISSAQISALIDSMQAQIRKKNNEKDKVKISNSLHARVFDTKSKQMLYSNVARVGHDQGLLIYFPVGYAVNREVENDDEIDIMLGSGKYDITGKEVFRYDIFINRKKDKWLVDMDEDELQWVAFNVKTNEKFPLYKFTRIKVVGSLYEEVKDE